MEIITYPLNNTDYSAESVAIYNSTRTTGIYAGEDFAADVSAGGTTITVGTGLAWMRISKFFGVAVAMMEQTEVDMGLPDPYYPRIDALILKYDANKNATEITVKKGTAESTPKEPKVTRTETVHEIHLYQVRREPSETAIAAERVTDLRLDSEYCGLMADAVTQVDTSAINKQVAALIEDLRKALEAVEDQTYYASKTYVDSRYWSVAVTLAKDAWENGKQTVAVSGVTEDESKTDVMASPDPADSENRAAYMDNDVYIIQQLDGAVVFACDSVPDCDLIVNVAVTIKGETPSGVTYPDGDEVAYGG